MRGIGHLVGNDGVYFALYPVFCTDYGLQYGRTLYIVASRGMGQCPSMSSITNSSSLLHKMMPRQGAGKMTNLGAFERSGLYDDQECRGFQLA